jgi:hypothetical protein
MGQPVEKEFLKELEAKLKAEQKLRQEAADKERATLILLMMKAELNSKFSKTR